MINETSMKNEFKYWGWLLLAFFLMDSYWLFDSLVLNLTGRPIPSWLHIILFAWSVFLGLIAATLFFKKSFAMKGSSRSAFLTLLCSALTVSAVLSATPVVMRGWVYYLTGMIRSGSVNSWAAAISLWGLILLLLIIAVFACYAAIAFMLYDIPVHKTGKTAARLGVLILKKLPVFLLLTLAAILAAVLMLDIMKPLEGLLSGIMPYGFFSRYVLSMVFAGAKTALAFFLIYSVRVLLAKDGDGLREEVEKPLPGSYLYPVAVAFLTVALIACNIIPYLSGPQQLTDSLKARIIQADNLVKLGQGASGSSEYFKAGADLLAFQAYLQGIVEIRQSGELNEANELFAQAEALYANSSFIPYFKGMLQILADPQNASSPDTNKLFMTAAHNSAAIPEARIWTINGFRASGEDAKASEALNLLIAQGIFTDRFASLGNANTKKLTALRKETEKIKALLEQRELDILLSKAEYEPASSILPEFLEYAERSASPDAYYHLALLAEHIPNPEYMYEYAKKYFESQAKEDSEAKEIETALFTSYMYVKSGHPNEAEKLMKSMYEKYSGNPDISCDYVYTLLENQKPAQAVALINACPAKQEPCMLYLQAIACMESHDYKAALQAIDPLCLKIEAADTDSKTLRELDDYVYRFLLEYLHICSSDSEEDAKLLAELEKIKVSSILSQYLLGLNAKQAEDYELSNRHFAKILEINPNLAYPYYLLGINYNEMAGYLKKDCYPLAEKYFLNFIDRRPDVVEGYFCLGFVYKHIGDQSRAARAFRKVADYNPKRDNPLYEPFSMNNHALDEIEKIREEK